MDIILKVRPGFQLDVNSPVTAAADQPGTTDTDLCAINGEGPGTPASISPLGTPEETVIFTLTSGCNAANQDLIRITGIKLRIISPEGAAGNALSTMEIDTTSVGGAFSGQPIIAAVITRGAVFAPVFSVQPGTSKAGSPLLPEIKLADYGGNTITTVNRNITLSLQVNPGNSFLNGVTVVNTLDGKVTWEPGDQLRIEKAKNGYVIRATADGASFLSSNSTNSLPFNITPGYPGKLTFTTHPINSGAGRSLFITIKAFDNFNNESEENGIPITLSANFIPNGAPLLVGSSLTLLTENGAVVWSANDNLRINQAGTGIVLTVSGVGSPVSSNPFDIFPGPAGAFNFVQLPTTTLVGQKLKLNALGLCFSPV